MMPIDKRWDELSDSDWDAFAEYWISKLESSDADLGSEILESVVMMNFTAKPEHQWKFILAAVAHASSEEALGHIAAGPVEHLLGKHGDQYIDKVEQRAETDPRFSRMMLGVWKYMMTDEVWERVESLKARIEAEVKE